MKQQEKLSGDNKRKLVIFLHKITKNVKNNIGDNMYYINSFFIYSVIGFLMESALYKIFSIDNYSGFLSGPITPVYGIGVLIILITNKYIIEKIKTNRFLKIIISFFVFAILLSLIELLGGVLLKELLNVELWNYSNKKYNIGKYMCLELALVWGVFSLLFIYFIKPFMDKLIKKIPKKATYVFVIAFAIDIIYSLIFKY